MTSGDGSNDLAWLARHDGTVGVGYGPFQRSATPPADGIAFHVQDFAAAPEQPWCIPARWEHLDRIDFAARHPIGQPFECEWQPLDASPFSVVFQEIMAAIHEGTFEKTVPVVTEHGHCQQAPGPIIASRMARIAAPHQSYGFLQGDSGFAGATPELLVSIDGHHLNTMALAGTARREDREVFAVDEKEIREHEYVAQTLVAKLLDLGTLQRDPRQILDLGPIVHFLTRIRVELHQPMTPGELLKRLHPTPALGPLPKTITTMNQLLDWRQRMQCPPGFGAPFGLWDHGRFDAVVAIRGLWWDGQQVRLPAGCGIIEASRLVNEWRELRLKREAVKKFLTSRD